MKKFLLAVVVLIIIAVLAFVLKDAPTATSTGVSNLIRVAFPTPNAQISSTSPLTVTGEARGNWYFEATFPVIVVNWDGLIIGEGYAQAEGEWMTTDFVPFKGTINFDKPECSATADYCKRGAVIFKKDNPSGLPENDAAVEIPIRFE